MSDKPKKNVRGSEKKLRDIGIARDRLFGDGESLGKPLDVRQLAVKYDLKPKVIRNILSQPEIKAIEEAWLQQMYAAHRAMGQAALEATVDLIQQREPTTVNNYWKRMGVTREPQVDVQIEELTMKVPDEVKAILAKVLGDDDARQTPTEPGD